MPDAAHVVLGMGCSSGTALDEMISLADRVLGAAGVERPDAIATLAARQDDAVWQALAARYKCGLIFFDPARLEAETPRLAHPSEAVFRVVGCHGVAEAAALAGVGPHGVLAVAKTASAHATAALAKSSKE